MGGDADPPLNPKNVKHLLPSDIFHQLFSESNEQEEHQIQSDSDLLINWCDEVTEPNGSVRQPSSQNLAPGYERSQRNTQHALSVQHALPVQQAFTWPQLLLGDLTNNFQAPGLSFESPQQPPEGERMPVRRRKTRSKK